MRRHHVVHMVPLWPLIAVLLRLVSLRRQIVITFTGWKGEKDKEGGRLEVIVVSKSKSAGESEGEYRTRTSTNQDPKHFQSQVFQIKGNQLVPVSVSINLIYLGIFRASLQDNCLIHGIHYHKVIMITGWHEGTRSKGGLLPWDCLWTSLGNTARTTLDKNFFSDPAGPLSNAFWDAVQQDFMLN